ncbi:hypothetical protein GWK08_18165 [Leptobacterium flavescens]|uniref:DUF4097 family beta strand repeat protein n=1 Tax=Leptobacterium flavescens TaxID=472055 RepID=A0A6P0UY66_9FLAO|nr:hypothetical protein [Leptobacterium flavescens]NER15386.1 hypothetical protein [Leptobacterium flavescens]
MKSFKYQTVLLRLLALIFTIGVNGQSFTKSKKHRIPVGNTTTIEVISSYTNLEFEQTEGNEIVIEAVMQIDGLSQKEAEKYFKKWKVVADHKNDKVVLSSLLNDATNTNWQRHSYYEGYFLDETQLTAISDEIGTHKNAKSTGEQKNASNTQNTGKFDQEAYINEGDAYLLKWQKENNEKIGRRWFNKTREERIAMLKGVKAAKSDLPSKGSKSSKEERSDIAHRIQQEARSGKNRLPSANVRPLKKRTVIKKTLKIGVPKKLGLSINMKHGKLVLHNQISDIRAELKHALLEAETISGSKTRIKGIFSNFEIGHWQAGKLDVAFSGFALIKRADQLSVTSNSSVVSVDAVTKSIDASGNFKMLNIEASSSITYAKIDVVDSKKVWVKLPDAPYNLYYRGTDSRLIHPEKYSLKTGRNRSEKILENAPLKNKERYVDIKALASVMQIYDIPWEDLKIKNLEDL